MGEVSAASRRVWRPCRAPPTADRPRRGRQSVTSETQHCPRVTDRGPCATLRRLLMDSWESQHRAVLLRRTGATCAFCGVAISMPFGSGWTVARWITEGEVPQDHETRVDLPGNLWPVCAGCADDMGDLDGQRYIERRLERGYPVHPRWQAYARVAAAVVGTHCSGPRATVQSSWPPRRAG